jgi:hypothetical protein
LARHRPGAAGPTPPSFFVVNVVHVVVMREMTILMTDNFVLHFIVTWPSLGVMIIVRQFVMTGKFVIHFIVHFIFIIQSANRSRPWAPRPVTCRRRVQAIDEQACCNRDTPACSSNFFVLHFIEWPVNRSGAWAPRPIARRWRAEVVNEEACPNREASASAAANFFVVHFIVIMISSEFTNFFVVHFIEWPVNRSGAWAPRPIARRWRAEVVNEQACCSRTKPANASDVLFYVHFIRS